MNQTITSEHFEDEFVSPFAFITVYDRNGYQLIRDMAEAIQADMYDRTMLEVARGIVDEVPCRIEKVWSGNDFHYDIHVL